MLALPDEFLGDFGIQSCGTIPCQLWGSSFYWGFPAQTWRILTVLVGLRTICFSGLDRATTTHSQKNRSATEPNSYFGKESATQNWGFQRQKMEVMLEMFKPQQVTEFYSVQNLSVSVWSSLIRGFILKKHALVGSRCLPRKSLWSDVTRMSVSCMTSKKCHRCKQ